MCEEHFEACCFRQTKRKLLTKTAVPTLFNIPNPPPQKTSARPSPKKRLSVPVPQDRSPPPCLSSSSSTSFTMNSVDIDLIETPQEKSLKRKLQNERAKTSRLRKKMKLVDNSNSNDCVETVSADQQSDFDSLKPLLSKYLSPEACDFILTQVRVAGLSKHARRWTYKDKSFALALFHASRKAYFLIRKIFSLPSPRTLASAMSNINIRPGLCRNMLNLFRVKIASMTKQEKLCAVVIDEMALKRGLHYDSINDEVEGLEDYGHLGRTKNGADHALVIMLRGIVNHWKQPIAYFLSKGAMSSNILQAILTEVLKEVFLLGVSPKVVIWDQGSNNRCVMQKLGVTVNHPYTFIGGRKLFMMYDPPHLMKSIRNNFKRHGYKYGTDDVSWRYIEKFYEMDAALPIRMAPKLTKRHIAVPAFADLSVKLAVQVLSHTVAAGITTMVRLKALEPNASATANFISSMDKLFNCFNSRNFSNKAPMAHAFSASSGHVAFLQHACEDFKRLRCKNKTGSLPCLTGWQLSINCLLQLWDDLSSNEQVSYLLTSRLNQDCLENLFSVIRGKGGHRTNPTPREFRASIKQTMVDAILVTGEGKNCQEDVDTFLFSFEHIASQGAPSIIKRRVQQDLPLNMRPLLQVCVDQILFTVPEQNIMTYISGYVARKLRSVLCNHCKTLLVKERGADQSEIFIQEKQYDSTTDSGLFTPSDILKKVLNAAEHSFRANASSLVVSTSLRFKLVKKMIHATKNYHMVCPEGKCHLVYMALNLYANIRLHHHIKGLNISTAAASQRKTANRKVSTLRHL